MEETYVNSAEQYFLDVKAHASTRYSEEEKVDLAKQARLGDREARHLIILACVPYVIRIAVSFYSASELPHDDLFDLIGIGNLELVEKFDAALEKQDCFGYLKASAKYSIRHYCYYLASLIARPSREERKALVASLESLLENQVDVDFPVVEEALPDKSASQAMIGPMYEALGTLTDRQREVLIRHYGLFDQPEEQMSDIDRVNVAWSRHRLAVQTLRKRLDHLIE